MRYQNRTKYHNRKITHDGDTFDSVREYRRYCELSLLEKAGVITNLERQVKFELIPAQKDRATGRVIERACSYVADYVYYDQNGKRHVEDVKGYKGGGAYAVFSIKRKLMLYFHGIVVEEV